MSWKEDVAEIDGAIARFGARPIRTTSHRDTTVRELDRIMALCKDALARHRRRMPEETRAYLRRVCRVIDEKRDELRGLEGLE